LNRFSALSVRDENSWHLVRNGTNREPTLVLDPCLQFADVIPLGAPPEEEPFALVYGHGFPAWLARRVRAWAGRNGVRLLSIGYSNDFADEQRIAADPHDFARLMAGAEAVITNFFHGCVFALLNGKPWISAPSEYRSIKIPDLAATLGAENRLVEEDLSRNRLTELLETPVQRRVLENIDQARARSSDYLDAALS
jgi:Polysaccharide pyruvyl transferase